VISSASVIVDCDGCGEFLRLDWEPDQTKLSWQGVATEVFRRGLESSGWWTDGRSHKCFDCREHPPATVQGVAKAEAEMAGQDIELPPSLRDPHAILRRKGRLP